MAFRSFCILIIERIVNYLMGCVCSFRWRVRSVLPMEGADLDLVREMELTGLLKPPGLPGNPHLMGFRNKRPNKSSAKVDAD